MLDSGLRFAFAFLPAGVAIVVGLVLAVQRRRVQPEVAKPAIAGLALQLVAALLSASTVVVLPALISSGSSASSVLTASSLIGVLTALLTVLGWVLLLIALFRRLPATAPTAVSAPTPAAGLPGAPVPPGPPPPGQPPADDAPTGRHALLDEHGQVVVAQEGVRLSPRTAALTGGAALGAAGTAGAAGAAAAAAAHGEGTTEAPGAPAARAEEMPTEAVPIVGHPGTQTEAEDERASDAGPAGVDEGAVGGMPTEAPHAEDDEDGDTTVTEAAVGGVPTGSGGAAGPPGSPGAEASDTADSADSADAVDSPHPADDEAVTETLHTHGPQPATPTPTAEHPPEGGTGQVDEAAVGGTPTAAAEPPPDPSPVSVDEGAVGGVPTETHEGPADDESQADGETAAELPHRPEARHHPGIPLPKPSTPATAERPGDDDSSTTGAGAAPSGTPVGTTPQPGAGGDDLFRPDTPATSVPDEAVGGTPAGARGPARTEEDEEPPGRVEPRTSQVAGWFEPVTSSQESGFSRPDPAREDPGTNGHHQGR